MGVDENNHTLTRTRARTHLNCEEERCGTCVALEDDPLLVLPRVSAIKHHCHLHGRVWANARVAHELLVSRGGGIWGEGVGVRRLVG